MNTVECRGCGKKIHFIKTPGGKNVPCDTKEISLINEQGMVVRGYT